MKLNELFVLSKKDKPNYTQTQQDYFKKNGFVYVFSAHSQDKQTIIRNYEKDCVVAYCSNIYITLALIKLRTGYKGLIMLDGLNHFINGAFQTCLTNAGDLLKLMKQDAGMKIVSQEDYSNLAKQLMLQEIEK